MPIETWIDLCALDDIPVRGSRRVTLSNVEIAVFRTSKNAVFAIDNRCPHKAGPLSEGIVHANSVTCPLHSLIIDLETGKGQEEGSGCVAIYPVDIRDDRVFLKVES